jgi:cbb3-type cytochrome oxidase cytochrome c subunit
LTDGGENCPVLFSDLSFETQEKIRKNRRIEMLKNNPMKNPETAKKVSIYRQGIKYDDEYKKNMSNSLKNSLKHKKARSSQESKEKNRKAQEKNMIPINQYDLQMNLINTYPSIKEAGRQLNIKPTDISAVINYRQKTTKNFIFKKC